MTNPHHARLMASNAKLLQTGKYSDLTVRCGAREWQLHRSIVCEGSKFFAVACDGPFLESHSRVIDLKDDDPTIFEYLLLYLYTLDYEDGSQLKEDEGSSLAESTRTNTPDAEDIEATPGSPVVRNEDNDIRANPSESAPQIEDHPGQGRSSLMINVQVYAMADKFDIAELKVLAKQKFSKSAQGWPLPDFPRVVHEALTSTPESDRGLRDILRRILAEHVKDICPSDCPIDDSISRQVTPTATQILRQQWYDALRDEGRFLYEVLGTFASDRAQLEAGLWMTNLDLTTDLQSSQQETLMLSINVHRLDLQKASDMAELEPSSPVVPD